MIDYEDIESDPDLVFERPALMPPEEKGGLWELAYEWTLFYRGEVYHIPAGFQTDGASIPRFLWRVCGTPLDVPRIYAAIVHDWLYFGGKPEATRADADAIYRDLLIALGESSIKAFCEWGALRLCGGSHWQGQKTPKKEKGKTAMKKLMMLAAVAAVAAAITGCKSIEVERHAQSLATIKNTDGTETVVKNADGNPVILDGGWAVDYFQHWNWQKFDSLHATAGKDVALDINNYQSGADTNLAALVATSFDGGTKLVTAIGDAYVKIAGGGAQAAATLSTAKKVYEYFIGKGGDASKAAVTTEGDKLQVSDGTTCVQCDAEGNCTDCELK